MYCDVDGGGDVVIVSPVTLPTLPKRYARVPLVGSRGNIQFVRVRCLPNGTTPQAILFKSKVFIKAGDVEYHETTVGRAIECN